MQELEANRDKAGASTRKTNKALLVQKNWLKIDNLTLNISSIDCPAIVEIVNILYIHIIRSNQPIFFSYLINYSLLLFYIEL